VTGAASGLGASFAKRLGREQFDLVLVDRQADGCEKCAEELRRNFGVKVCVIVQDLTVPGAAASICAQCDARGLAIDCLVNNAGYHLNKLLHELPWSVIEANLQLLMNVVVEMSHVFLPGMIRRGWGRIINVASVSGFMPGGIRLATYNAAKAFLIPFSESLDFELAGSGVRVTAVCPGFMRTSLFVNSGLTDVRDSVPRFMWLDPDQVADRGFHSVMNGHSVFVAGNLNRLIVTAAKFLPRSLLRERSRIFHRSVHGRRTSRGQASEKELGRRRVALVTGATSGIGASVADVLAERNHDLILVARREEVLRRRAAELTGRHGIEVRVIVQDLTNPDAVQAIWEQCQDFGWPVDVLVNNAGYPVTELFSQMSLSEVQAVMHISTRAIVQLTHTLMPGMIARGWGKVINVASMAAFEPGSYRSSLYSSSKAFLVGFSESIAAELDGTGVSVTAVCPGFTKTGWAAKNRLDNASVPGLLWMESEAVARAGVDAAMRGRSVKVVGTFPLRIISTLLQMAPRHLVGSLLSRKRRGMAA